MKQAITDNIKATHKRLMAGTAILSLMISGQFIPAAMAQTAAEDTRPVCEKQDYYQEGNTFTRLAAGNLPSDPPRQIAWFELPPETMKGSGLTIKGDAPEFKFNWTQLDSDILGKEVGDLAWKEWSVYLPQFIDEKTGEVLEGVGVTIFLDNGKRILYRNYESYTSFSKETGAVTLLNSKRIAQNDEQVAIGKGKGDPIRSWIEGDALVGNIVIQVMPVEDVGKPEAEQRVMGFVYRKPRIMLTRSYTDNSLALVKARHREGTCRLYKSTGCFLTTASCDVVGLEDSCWELQTLRAFRDDWLSVQIGGDDDIQTYYNSAPQIVEAINARSDARDIWLSLYARYITPCAVMAKFGLKKSARNRYSKMMTEMSAYL